MEQTKMTSRESLNLLAQAAAMYKGNLQEHTALQDAVRILNELIEESEKDTETDQ